MATKGSSFPLVKLQDQLTCGRCHNLYTKPKTLSCHHSFCQECIEGLATIPTFSVACPTCHQHTELPDHAGAAGFSVAPHLVEFRKIYEEMKQLSGEVLNPDLTFCRSFGTKGTGDGEFKGPVDVAIDSEGLVYVTDYNNHRVQKFTHDGKYLVSKFGGEGSGPGQLNRPAGIAVDNAGLVYVSEYNNHRVSIFTSDGVFVRSFGEEGANEDQFYRPHVGMTFDKDGFLYICDTCNDRLVVY
uniref:RING-type domain-containing protein n=1 Tax=Amphimedon queenslandica TaxID=400682 RepID=A0A1X7TMF1_AMPQE